MQSDAIKDRVEEHPDLSSIACPGIVATEKIKSKIEERIRSVPEANRERAFINAATTEAMNQTVRPVGNAVRP